MAYLVQPVDQPVVWVPDTELAAYLAAGWVQASATQIAAYNSLDPYNGTQTAPHASLHDPKTGKPLAPMTKHVR